VKVTAINIIAINYDSRLAEQNVVACQFQIYYVTALHLWHKIDN